MKKECIKEIEEYLISKGYKCDIGIKFYDNHINRGYWISSKEGRKRNLDSKFCWDDLKIIDRHFLNFIGHILRKYNITKMDISPYLYKSQDWKINNIN